ncbi:two component transcriptional regulator, LuxR family [Dyella sp. OK004]|uniref:response regulator transcription factor n=1 Tax=Dyella sp. OK004 TaxID=1855292 RepID=UPI0008F1D891|nr:response regulator transcription factor [Dyella sp. OK004]SFS06358.1 two component transcriptional regulator, LuxR family [Dyella sp. OK004]
MSRDRIRVLVADDHPFVHEGVRLALQTDTSIDMIGTAKDSSDLLRRLSNEVCHVVVCDYAMPGGHHGDGVTLLRLLVERHPETAVVILTALDRRPIIGAILGLGIQCIVSKADDLKHVRSAVHAAHETQRYLSPTIAAAMAAYLPLSTHTALSPRERQVISLLLQGVSVGDIATRLGRSLSTIGTQKANALLKLGLTNDADLFRYAADSGLLNLLATH